MLISKFHLLVYLLETYKTTDEDLREDLLTQINRIYKQRIPESLIRGIMAFDPNAKIPLQKEYSVWEDNDAKRCAWIMRRDKGNHIANENRKAAIEQANEKKKLDRQIKQEQYENAMKPKWDENYKNVMMSRENFLASLQN